MGIEDRESKQAKREKGISSGIRETERACMHPAANFRIRPTEKFPEALVIAQNPRSSIFFKKNIDIKSQQLPGARGECLATLMPKS